MSSNPLMRGLGGMTPTTPQPFYNTPQHTPQAAQKVNTFAQESQFLNQFPTQAAGTKYDFQIQYNPNHYTPTPNTQYTQPYVSFGLQ